MKLNDHVTNDAKLDAFAGFILGNFDSGVPYIDADDLRNAPVEASRV